MTLLEIVGEPPVMVIDVSYGVAKLKRQTVDFWRRRCYINVYPV